MAPPRKDASRALDEAVRHAAHLLPAQGPIRVFIHHNTLHAFDELPFEEAVVRAGERLGCEPFLAAEEYERALATGRIREEDVEEILAAECGTVGGQFVGGIATRLALRRALTLDGIPDAEGPALRWRLANADGRDALWEACVRAAERASAPPEPHRRGGRRHRDLLLAATSVDIDAQVDPVLIRFLGAWLDQGLAPWPMPGRERGIHAAFVELYGTRAAALAGDWAGRLPALIEDDRVHRRTAVESAIASLDRLGVEVEEWPDFVADTLLVLRGFAGLVRQLEQRPDRVTARPLPANLVDVLAVRLLLECAAIEHIASGLSSTPEPLATLRERLAPHASQGSPPAVETRAWALVHVAKWFRIDPETIDGIDAPAVADLEREIAACRGIERRRVLHLAYETALRRMLYDALAQHAPVPRASAPAFQAIFCIDEREESFRRHLEEVDPGVETFGAAGFFGVAMYYRSAGDAHPRPLCPVAVRPEHYVEESAPEGPLARRSRKLKGLLDHNIDLGSRTLVRGAFVMTLLGALALVPLVLGVVFPRLARRLRRVGDLSARRGSTRLLVERRNGTPPIGRHFGFTIEEMATIVERTLSDTGIGDRLAPLCLVVGHGSASLNNPHESAYDCGACGGGHGGANARAFAQMANDPRVREHLAARGAPIPEGTWFLGAERNTSSNSFELYDEQQVPSALRPLLARVREGLEETRRREAHERCRRFESAPHWYSPGLALAHVEARAADLAQPRPECGHATNAFCIVGRRARTTGLFLDRRAFLVSYDPTTDGSGAILARILASVVPVVAGINLEYWFCRVDPVGYGCGTKLPHNVVALLGVMDGTQSDIRPGLPWQMVELHEPVRLTFVVESPADRLRDAVAADPRVERLVANRWIILARLDPESGTVQELGPEGFVAHAPRSPLPIAAGASVTWYGGKRDNLSIAAIVPARAGKKAS